LAALAELVIEQLGPLRNTKVELGDVTLIFGYPNSGKSYTLRAIYESLMLHDPPVVRTCLARMKPLDSRIVRIEIGEVSRSRGEGAVARRVKVCIDVERLVDMLRDRVERCSRAGLLPPHSVEFRGSGVLGLEERRREIAETVVEVFSEKARERYPDATLSVEGKLTCTIIPKLPLQKYSEITELIPVIDDAGDEILIRDVVLRAAVASMLGDLVDPALLVEEALRRLTGGSTLSRVVYAAYGRSLLSQAMLYTLLEKEKTTTAVIEAVFASRNIPALSLFHALYEGYRSLREDPNLLEKLVAIFSPLLGGRVNIGDAEIAYQSDGAPVPLNMASALAGEAVALMLAAAAVARHGSGLLLIEEPEAQLHPRYQMLVPLALYGLAAHGVKVVVTTHSPIVIEVAATLARLAHSDQRRLLRAVEKLLARAAPRGEPEGLAGLLADSIPRLSVLFYYFDGSRAVRFDAEKLVEESVPSHTDVDISLTKWVIDISAP